MLTEEELIALKRVIISVHVAQKRGAYELQEAHAIFESLKILDSLIKKNLPDEEEVENTENTD